MKRPNAWNDYTPAQLEELDALTSDYMAFISANKTERECCASGVEMARKAGYANLEDCVREGLALKAGDKVYAVNRGKMLLLVELGTEPLANGLNILGAHIDCPRLDVKQVPLEETDGLAYLDTHYYGGIKKYQWLTLPLALHGVICKKDGSTVEVRIGEDPFDPVLYITDLLPHLGSEQMGKKASEFVPGEALDVLAGNRPLTVEGDETPVRAQVLQLLANELGIDEEDFLSAELEVVPAGPARDLGLDRSMIMGYGQDDRSNAYPCLVAQLACEHPRRTAATLLVDKEEIGSMGATGMASTFFEDAMAEICALASEEGALALRRCLHNSKVLSCDVSAAYDPAFASVFEKKNSSFLGHGLSFMKYTGARGKSGSNDASAEYVAEIRRIMDEAGVHFQTCELGRVDAGGGGTIAYVLARYGMSVIDCGVPVISMHARGEVASKADVYEAYRGYRAFLDA
ncbi:MAG: aminopeptidase [Atopobiaceae bacterium]|nr:aminopeptidase [Atopobiaceae bacterium]